MYIAKVIIINFSIKIITGSMDENISLFVVLLSSNIESENFSNFYKIFKNV